MEPRLCLADLPLDVVDEIVKHLAHRAESDPPLSTTLVSCALVCRALQRPALQALWEQDQLLHHVFSTLLPKYMISWVKYPHVREADDTDYEETPDWARVGDSSFPGEYTYNSISGPISPEDWSRFTYYAQFIRVLICPKEHVLDPSIFMYLHQHTHGEPLLPNLRELIWEHASADIIAVLSPTIRVLRLPAEIEEEMLDEQDELAFRTRRHALKTLLPDVLRGLPELGCLQLSPLGHIEHWHKLMDKREGSFAARRLVSLWLLELLPVLMNGALQLLSTSTQLEQLKLILLHRDSSKPLGSVSSLEPCTYTFRELHTLNINGSMVAMELVMNTINAPELRHVDIGLCELGGSARVHHILQKILATLSSRSKSIRTVTLRVGLLSIPAQTPFFTIMEPLSQLHLLQDVTINMPRGCKGRMAQVPPDLFESWPGLQTLTLSSVHICPEALEAAARSCPGLKSLTVLHLSEDFARHPYVVAAATSDARTLAARDSHGLQTLGLLGWMGMTDYMDLEVVGIASFLVALFPSLRVEPLEGLKEWWSPIVTEISRIQAAR